MPFIIHAIGDRDYGIWVLVGSIMGYYGLLDFGITSAVVRYVSKFSAVKDDRNINQIFNTSLFLFSLVAMVVIMASTLLASTISLWVKVPKEQFEVLSKIIMIVGLSLAISFPCRVFGGILRALVRYDIVSGIRISSTFFRTILIILFLKKGGGLLSLAYITFFVSLGTNLLLVFFTLKEYNGLKIGFSYIHRDKFRSIFSYALFTFVIMMADRLRFCTDSLVIGGFLSVAAITYFAIAGRLVEHFKDLVTSLLGVLTPVYSSYESQNDYQKIRELVLLSTKYSALVSFFIGSLLILYGKEFISLWVGEKFNVSYNILIVLTIPYIIALVQSPSVSMLYGISKHNFFAYVTIIEGLTNVILSILLVKKFGLIGVALGTAIPMFFVKTFIQPFYVCKIIKLSVFEYFLKSILRPLAASIGFIVIISTIKWIGPAALNSYFNMLVFLGISSLIFCTIIYYTALDQKEKAFLKGRLLYFYPSIGGFSNGQN